MKGTTLTATMDQAIDLAFKEFYDMTPEDFIKELEANKGGDVHKLIKFADELDIERINDKSQREASNAGN